MTENYDNLKHPSSLHWRDALKRDMDLVRTILMRIEESGDPGISDFSPFLDESYTNEQIQYHLGLIYQAGLIDAEPAGSFEGASWIVKGLTWNGHEFVEAARDKNRWQKAKDIVLDKVGSLAFSHLLPVLLDLGLQRLGLKR
jgi:hypothetical protein